MQKIEQNIDDSWIKEFNKEYGKSDSNGDLFIQTPNEFSTASEILKSFIHKTLSQAQTKLLEDIVEEIKNGVAYGKFGFSRTDKGENYGQVAINLDDIINLLAKIKKE